MTTNKRHAAPSEIRAARLAAGLTQKQMAEKMGYSTRIIQDWEHGRRNCRRTTFNIFLHSIGAL